MTTHKRVFIGNKFHTKNEDGAKYVAVRGDIITVTDNQLKAFANILAPVPAKVDPAIAEAAKAAEIEASKKAKEQELQAKKAEELKAEAAKKAKAT